jgi:hypothetical protein
VLVGHEAGHEYVWAEYERASSARDHARLRELELLCDAIAVVTLHGLGIEPVGEWLVGQNSNPTRPAATHDGFDHP